MESGAGWDRYTGYGMVDADAAVGGGGGPGDTVTLTAPNGGEVLQGGGSFTITWSSMGTIVNVALPSAQQDLGFSDDSRQWIITAYTLAFGSLLLLGGRLGPARTAAICAVSPALWMSSGAAAPGAFDGPDDFAANSVFGMPALASIPIRVDCGDSDPFYSATKQFVAQLPPKQLQQTRQVSELQFFADMSPLAFG